MVPHPFTDVPAAIEEIRNGRMIVVVDDEDRENEGDLTLAAETVSYTHLDVYKRQLFYRSAPQPGVVGSAMSLPFHSLTGHKSALAAALGLPNEDGRCAADSSSMLSLIHI